MNLSNQIKKNLTILCLKCKSEDIFFTFSSKNIKYKIMINCLSCNEKSDYFLDEYIKSLKNLFENQKFCSCQKKGNVHKNKNADFFCETCKKLFCEECINEHNILIDNHSIISISEYNPNKINYICEYHSNPFIYYCDSCQCHLCENCKINEHLKNQHKMEKLTENYLKINKESLLDSLSNLNNFLNVDLLEYKNKFIKTLQDFINKINSLYDDYIFENRNILSLINFYFENFPENKYKKNNIDNINNLKEFLNSYKIDFSDIINNQKIKELYQKINEFMNKSNLYSLLKNLEYSKILENKEEISFVRSLFSKNYNFNLIYQATRDGSYPSNFHKNCDNKGPTISFIKTNDNKKFGGFISKDRQSGSEKQIYVKDKNAFIFSINKKSKYLIKDENTDAFDYSSSRGLNFTSSLGFYYNEDSGNMFKPKNSYESSEISAYNSKNKYEFAGKNNFQAVEIEVFQVLNFSEI